LISLNIYIMIFKVGEEHLRVGDSGDDRPNDPLTTELKVYDSLTGHLINKIQLSGEETRCIIYDMKIVGGTENRLDRSV
jgi:hypothetical protein